MTPAQLARDALAALRTAEDALVRIAGMESTCAEPTEYPDGIKELYVTTRYADRFGTIRLNEWPEGIVLWVGGQIRWRSWRDPEFIRRATEQAAREAAMGAVRTEADARAAVYAQTADDEAGRVAWGNGEPFDPWKSADWQRGWRDGQERWGKENVA